ncbi:MAG: hypothetical protein ACREHD_27505 [Pirellulales bacterium]
MPAPRLTLATFSCVAMVLALLIASPSQARGRGGSGSMRAYMRVAQMQAKWMQQQMQTYQTHQKDKYDAFMKRFDTNKNGKIDGKEKGPAQKYLRQLDMGKDPDKAMKSLGRTSSASSRSK